MYDIYRFMAKQEVPFYLDPLDLLYWQLNGKGLLSPLTPEQEKLIGEISRERMVRGAPIGTFGYFDRVYTRMGGRTPEAGDPALITDDHSRQLYLSRDPSRPSSVNAQGEAEIRLVVYEGKKRWSAQITNADQVLSLTEDGVERAELDLDEVLKRARSVIDEVRIRGGVTSSPLPLF